VKIHDITLGGYVPVESVLHSLDPRLKVLSFVLILLVVFVHADLLSVGYLGGGLLVLAALSRVGWAIWLWSVRRFLVMLLVVAIFNLLFGPPGRILTVWGVELPFSVEAVQQTCLFCLQLLEGIVLSCLLTFTTSPSDLTRGLTRLALPFKRIKVPVDEWATILLLSIRFLPILQGEIKTIVEAQQSRGVDFREGSPVVRVRRFAALFVPALNAVLRRADVMTTALEARGFRPGQERTCYRAPEFMQGDYLAGACVALFLASRFLLIG